MKVRGCPHFFIFMGSQDRPEVVQSNKWEIGPVAQWLEQRTHNPLVPGSSPGGPTKFVTSIQLRYRTEPSIS